MKYYTIRIECKNSKFNYYTITDKKRYLLTEWVNYCVDFHDGFGVVKKDGKYNYVKFDGTYLLSEWADCCWDFYDGFGKYRKDGGWYEVDKSGNIKEINEILYD